MEISFELIAPAFALGLAGSLHCVGMCGPLALSLPVSHTGNLSRISGGLIYNSGRIFSYAIIGLLFGSLGSLVIATRWQSSLSVALGIIILLYLFIGGRFLPGKISSGYFKVFTFLNKPFLLLRQQLGRLFQSKKLSSLFFIGILNGFLPCGLVYMALSSSVITASSLNGGMFMLLFGLGTFPMMFATVLLGNFFNQSLRRKIYKAVPALLFFMAVLLILRGMNLGIPFISPEITDNHSSSIECH